MRSMKPSATQAAALVARPNHNFDGGTGCGWISLGKVAMRVSLERWNHIKANHDEEPHNIHEMPVHRCGSIRAMRRISRFAIARQHANAYQNEQAHHHVSGVKARDHIEDRAVRVAVRR